LVACVVYVFNVYGSGAEKDCERMGSGPASSVVQHKEVSKVQGSWDHLAQAMLDPRQNAKNLVHNFFFYLYLFS